MTGIVKRLSVGAGVEVVRGTDHICSHCPKMVKENQCETNEKVEGIDARVVAHFEISTGRYVYADVVEMIKSKATADMMDHICQSCEWYATSKCKEKTAL